MGPYVASAEATSASYARTAVCRPFLVVKTLLSRRRWWVGGKGVPASNIGSHCGQVTPSGLEECRCDEARPVTRRSSETGPTAARCSTLWCSPDAGGCVRPVPTVAAPVPKTAAAPRRMRMRKFIARSAAWWLRWGASSGHRMLAARAKRARGWCLRVCVRPDEGG
eukprot:scaffold6810_cov57-Phaeocystis_antarctica.AAC.1